MWWQTFRGKSGWGWKAAVSACLAIAACNHPGAARSTNDSAVEAQGGSAELDEAAPADETDVAPQLFGAFAAFNPENAAAPAGGAGAGGTGGEPAPIVAPFGVSTACGDAIVGVNEECDDGPGDELDACTDECQTRDQPAEPTPEAGSDRFLGAGRHPVSGLDDGFAAVFMEETADELSVVAARFNIWGQPLGRVRLSDGASPILSANPVVAALPGGAYAAAWSDFNADGSDLGVALRRIEPDGTLGPLTIANSAREFSQLNPDMLWTGSELVVAWEDYSDPSAGPDLKFRTYNGHLSATSDELTLAGSALPEAAVALAPFAGTWAAAYREGATDGSEHIVVVAGNQTFRIGPVLGGPLDDRPALVELDATHLLVVFSAGTDPDLTGVANVPRIRYAVIDTADETPPATWPHSALEPLDDVFTLDQRASHLSPAAVTAAGGAYVAWRSGARSADAAGDQIWLKYLSWAAAAEGAQSNLDVHDAEMLIPRTCEESIGDQGSPALARTGLPPYGGLALAWDDFGHTQGQIAGEPDVIVHYAPTHERVVESGDVFEERWRRTHAGPWASWWSGDFTGSVTSTVHLEQGRVQVTAATTSRALMYVNRYEALNVDVTTELSFNLNAVSGGVVARRNDADPDSYLGAFFGTSIGEALRVVHVIDGMSTTLASHPLPAHFSVFGRGRLYRLRFRAMNSESGDILLSAKYWSSDLPEPADWMVQASITTGTPANTLLANRAGRFGVYAGSALAGRHITFDDFRARFFPGTHLRNLDEIEGPVRPLRRGPAGFRPCRSDAPCDAGAGCCLDSSECASGLSCQSSQSEEQGIGSHALVCAPSHCSDLIKNFGEERVDCGGPDCAACTCLASGCSSACPCGIGEGQCTNNDHCIKGLICQQEIGYKYGLPNGTDVCTPSHCSNRIQDGDEERADWGGSCGSPACNDVNGSYAHCSVFCPCASGHGDCNFDDECQTGLRCGGNNGAQFGIAPGAEACVPPHCMNNVLDAALGETGIDCGGACGLCL
jgi:hypothetical protein